MPIAEWAVSGRSRGGYIMSICLFVGGQYGKMVCMLEKSEERRRGGQQHVVADSFRFGVDRVKSTY